MNCALFNSVLVHQKCRNSSCGHSLSPDTKQDYPSAEKRLVEHARTLLLSENLVDPLPFGEHGRLGLTYETYKLALTEALLDAVFKDAAGNNKLDQAVDGVTTARAKLNDPASQWLPQRRETHDALCIHSGHRATQANTGSAPVSPALPTMRRSTSICQNVTPIPLITSPRWNTTRATCSWSPALMRWAIEPRNPVRLSRAGAARDEGHQR